MSTNEIYTCPTGEHVVLLPQDPHNGAYYCQQMSRLKYGELGAALLIPATAVVLVICCATEGGSMLRDRTGRVDTVRG
jgi:hypothetical protein